MIKKIKYIFLLTASLLMSMDVQHISIPEKKTDEQLSIKFFDNTSIQVPKKALLMFPYIQRKLQEDDKKNTVFISENDCKQCNQSSFVLVSSIAEAVYKEYNPVPIQFPEDIKFSVKSAITEIFLQNKIPVLAESIELFSFLKGPEKVTTFLCTQFVYILKKALLNNQEINFNALEFTPTVLKKFNFIKKQASDIFSTQLGFISLKYIRDSNIALSDIGKKAIIYDGMVPHGDLYAYIAPNNNTEPGVVYLVDLKNKKIKQSTHKHTPQNGYVYSLNTCLIPAVSKNIIASVMAGDNKVFFHTIDDQKYEPIELNVPESMVSTEYALSGDAKFFLAFYEASNGNYIDFFDVEEKGERLQKIKIEQSFTKLKGCLFNPVDSNTFVFCGDNNCTIVDKKDTVNTYLFTQKTLFSTKENELIIGVQFSPDGEYIYALTCDQENNKIMSYRWHYFSDKTEQSIGLPLEFKLNTYVKPRLVVTAQGEKLFVELTDTLNKKHLLDFDFKDMNNKKTAQELNFNITINDNIAIYRSFNKNTQKIYFFDCFFNKEIISLSAIEQMRALVGVSSDKALWIRTENNLLAAPLYEENIICFRQIVEEAEFTFEQYISLLKLLISHEEQPNNWYSKFLEIIPRDCKEPLANFLIKTLKENKKIMFKTWIIKYLLDLFKDIKIVKKEYVSEKKEKAIKANKKKNIDQQDKALSYHEEIEAVRAETEKRLKRVESLKKNPDFDRSKLIKNSPLSRDYSTSQGGGHSSASSVQQPDQARPQASQQPVPPQEGFFQKIKNVAQGVANTVKTVFTTLFSWPLRFFGIRF